MKGLFWAWLPGLVLASTLASGLTQANERASGQPEAVLAQMMQPAEPAEPGEEPVAPAEEPGVSGEEAGGPGQALIDALRETAEFTTFADVLERSGLAAMLDEEGPFTILAPTNDAFEQAAQVQAGEVEQGGFDFEQVDQEQLTDFVSNHLIQGVVSAQQLSTQDQVVTQFGTEYAIAPAGAPPVAEEEAPDGVAGGGPAEPAEPDEPAAPEEPDEPAAPEVQAPVEPGEPMVGEEVVGLRIGEATITHPGMELAGHVIYGIDSLLFPEGFGVEEDIGGGGPGQEPGAPAEPEEPSAPGEPADPGAPGDAEEPPQAPGNN